ncbi:MAG: hypothetical protein Q9159_007221 [Coniocarpon cinnabarinum]
MSKRAADEEGGVPLKAGGRPVQDEKNGEDVGPFEDDYEDEYESEDEIMVAGADGEPDDASEAAPENLGEKLEDLTFVPGRHKLEKGQVLNPDPSAYELLHSLESPWPCLSFDILRDQLGSGKARKQYPATVYAVAGTQAARGREKENEIMVMKMSKLSRMDRPEESSDTDDDDNDDDEQLDPILETRGIRTGDCTNRIRAYQSSTPTNADQPLLCLTAAMTESGQVLIHDISTQLSSFDTPGGAIPASAQKPRHTITSHGRNEGFALDWSPQVPLHPAPLLLTADTTGKIFCHSVDNAGSFTSDARPFTGHESSVEDLQWSPSESNVFASASADGTIRVWDRRSKARKPALSVRASDTDVNVLSWSRQTEYLIASGADDGIWAVWDLRQWKPNTSASPSNKNNAKGGEIQSTPVASFNWHKEQITSVEWHPTDDSVVCVASGDNTVTQWDVAVEHDDEESKYSADAKDVPPQLLFSHYQENVKECHWHPQQPGVVMATGGAGFGVFRTISV